MAQPHAASGDVIPLQPLGPALAEARSTALIKARQLELARIVLLAGKSMPEHHVAGEVTLLCLEGVLQVDLPGGGRRLQAGELIHIAAGAPHAVLAITDASALLTLCLAGP
jgi:quercetin dioxygenase-like cupin family protein